MKFRLSISNSKSPLRFISRLAVLTSAVVILQIVLFHTFGPWGFRVPHSEILHQIQGTNEEILYFGDSVTLAVGSRDKDRRMLPEMLAKYLPDREVISLRHSAYHPGMFYEYAKFLLRRGKLPQTIIIPLNLAAYSPFWALGPNYQFAKELAILKYEDNPWAAPFLHAGFAFRFFDLRPISTEQFESTVLRRGHTPAGVVGEVKHARRENATEADVRKYFLGWYLGAIETGSTRLSNLRQLAKLMSDNNRKVYYYFTPLDYQSGEQRFGPEFQDRVADNVETVAKVLKEFNMNALDLTRELPSSSFVWPYDERLPSEHLDESGRTVVAKKVAALLNNDLENLRLVP